MEAHRQRLRQLCGPGQGSISRSNPQHHVRMGLGRGDGHAQEIWGDGVVDGVFLDPRPL